MHNGELPESVQPQHAGQAGAHSRPVSPAPAITPTASVVIAVENEAENLRTVLDSSLPRVTEIVLVNGARGMAPSRSRVTAGRTLKS